MAHTTWSTASWTTQTLLLSALWVATQQGATSTAAQQQMASVCRYDGVQKLQNITQVFVPVEAAYMR
jgi:hypothetical protein